VRALFPKQVIKAVQFTVLLAGLAAGWQQGALAQSQQQFYMNGQTVSPNSYKAAQMVNQAVALLQQNRNQEAVDLLLQAEPMAPELANLHTDLGLGLAKLGRNQEALKELETARGMDPTSSNTLLTLGGLYQSQGQINQAISTYSDFLARFPQHKDAAKVQALVNGLKKEVSDGVIRPQVVNQGGAPSDNYLAELGPSAKRWPPNRLPLKVYVQDGSGVPGFRPQFIQLLQNSFAAWQEASQGGLAFNFVSTPNQADVVCSFTNDAANFNNRAEAGETELFTNSKGLAKGTIKLLTVPLVTELPLTDNRFHFFCLHEIGHAIGFGGHTSNPQDVMFYSASVSDLFPHLSPRDANSVRLLYSQ
jgi:tetratricopeptide (TPR) repeat protein